MSEHSAPLRLSVEQHQNLISASYPANIHRSCRSCRNAKTGNPFLCHKQSGNMLREYRQQCRSAARFDLVAVDHRDSKRHTASVHLYFVGRNHNPLQVNQAIDHSRVICKNQRTAQKPEASKITFFISLLYLNYYC